MKRCWTSLVIRDKQSKMRMAQMEKKKNENLTVTNVEEDAVQMKFIHRW
jgi:hypothetical protein